MFSKTGKGKSLGVVSAPVRPSTSEQSKKAKQPELKSVKTEVKSNKN
jgi:hypothetical protein